MAIAPYDQYTRDHVTQFTNMSKAKSPVAIGSLSPPQPAQLTHIASDDDVDNDPGIESESEVEKSETEEELERLVFGDVDGFRTNLKGFESEQVELDGTANEGTGLEGLDDADVGQAVTRIDESDR